MGIIKRHSCPSCGKKFKTADAVADHARDLHGIGKPAPVSASPTDDPQCAECGKTAHIVGGERIYPHRPDLFDKRFWLCECGAYCGCHGFTTRPLGFLAGADTRRARNNAHAVFDPLWKSGAMGRRDAYSWLAEQMGLRAEECHIGMMNGDQARKVIQLCNDRRKAAA